MINLDVPNAEDGDFSVRLIDSLLDVQKQFDGHISIAGLAVQQTSSNISSGPTANFIRILPNDVPFDRKYARSYIVGLYGSHVFNTHATAAVTVQTGLLMSTDQNGPITSARIGSVFRVRIPAQHRQTFAGLSILGGNDFVTWKPDRYWGNIGFRIESGSGPFGVNVNSSHWLAILEMSRDIPFTGIN